MHMCGWLWWVGFFGGGWLHGLRRTGMVGDSLVAIVIDGAAHHLDLR